jgi:fluoride exporter
MKILLLIGTGGFIGSVIRYMASGLIQARTVGLFPWGTMGVNIIGCLIIGVVLGFTDRGNLNPEWRLFIATGICGGFTTFSAFSAETIGLIRDGEWFHGFTYILISVISCCLATFTGIVISKMV